MPEGLASLQGKALGVSSGICIAAGLAGVLIMQHLEIQQRQLARVSVPQALGLVQEQQVSSCNPAVRLCQF